MTDIEYSLRPAIAEDAANVTALVNAAYGHYERQIGMVPRPMTDDYAEIIKNYRVTVAENNQTILGVIVLTVTDEGFLIDNVAVNPSHRGKGVGKALLAFAEAEARRAGFDSIYLYTHEKMTENIALYAKIGYVEYDRRSQGDFSLVYMRKHLSSEDEL
jgi:ribosomal protein S18 acetylase RimI-like enzyme